MSPWRWTVLVSVLGGLGALALVLRRWPVINDLTTTPEAPPTFKRLASAAPYPEAFAPVQRAHYPDLAPTPLPLPPAQAFALAAAAARAMPGWTVASEDPAALRLEAVAATRLWRFKDDIVVEVRPAPGGSAVHARSRSRFGRGDLGTNARRLSVYADALLGRLAGPR